MPEFHYTDSRELSSSLVDEVHFNENTNQLVVDLNDRIYLYRDVPKWRYRWLVDSDSPGREYAFIKRDFGPGEFLGEYNDVDYVYSPLNSNKVTPAPVPKNLTYAADAKVTDNTAPQPFLTLSVAEPRNTVRPHRVTFETGEQVRSHTLNVESVDAAVDAILEIADMLDLDFNVKEVAVSFE